MCLSALSLSLDSLPKLDTFDDSIIDAAAVSPSESVESTSFENYQSGFTFADDEDAVDVIRPEDLSGCGQALSQKTEKSSDSEATATGIHQ
jgi:hypothetical protein